MKKIHGFEDFLENLYLSGMSMGGENSEGIFTLCDMFGESIRWHTEKPDTDPWEWRMRVLNEQTDVAYGKFFFKKSGYITREWYPYFYATRRKRGELQEEYQAGNISQDEKKIYELISEHKELPLHLIKNYGGFSKEDKSKFDKAITELQMKFYITMCGRARKISKGGIYHYLPMDHSLEFITEVDNIETKVTDSLCEQKFAGKSAVVFYYSAVPYRSEWRYSAEAHKVMLIDSGHVMQNLYLSCGAIDCGTCAIAAFNQELADNLLKLDGEEEFVIYAAPVGAV